MSIDVMGKMCVDARNGQTRTTRKQDLGRRLDEDRLPAVQNRQTRRCGRIARNEPSIADDEQSEENKYCDHESRIPETVCGALMLVNTLAALTQVRKTSTVDSGFEGRFFT
jgi:hypothetical protein